jgi:CDP-glucose 4,6-dehydratase
MTSIGDSGFWRGRRVLVTGHTGFKGTWLCALLLRRGAAVAGIALPPDTEPALWNLVRYASDVESLTIDVRDRDAVAAAVARLRPQTIFHLAAQPLVLRGYAEPVETYATNVMGTVHVLDAARRCESTQQIVVVTSDKVYADQPSAGGYAEDARLGGADPYAGSKAAAELVVETYRSAYFSHPGAARVASARAGNVIGGGDFAPNRLIPDAFRALERGEPLVVRRPDAVRPWQHVLEPLDGYLTLAEALTAGRARSNAYNFGPDAAERVDRVARRFLARIGANADALVVEPSDAHETSLLAVDSTRARADLGWRPRWTTGEAVDATADWYRDYLTGEHAERLIARDAGAYYAG